MKLKGKNALITGSSRGIGRATAELFAKEGANVVINYVESGKKDVDKLVEKIKELGVKVISVECDVSKDDQVKEMVARVVEEFGSIDILVNNAGIVYDVPMFEKTVEQWKRTIEVNLIGPFLCSKYVSEHMKPRKSGVIVNISSTNGIDTLYPDSSDYDASKAGVISLTKNLACELALYNIRVNSVAPGWVNTDMNKDLPRDFVEEESKKIFVGRFAEPEEVAKAVLFLSCDDSSYVNGSILVVNGGFAK